MGRRAKSNDKGESHETFQCRSPVVENAKNCVAKAGSRTCQKKQASSDVLWGGRIKCDCALELEKLRTEC